MDRQNKTKMKPYVFSRPDAIVSIQVRYKERDENGKLQFKSSKNLTATGWTLDEAVTKIIEALSKKGA